MNEAFTLAAPSFEECRSFCSLQRSDSAMTWRHSMGPDQQRNLKVDCAQFLLEPFASLDQVNNIRYVNLPVYFPNSQVLLLLHVVILSVLSSPLFLIFLLFYPSSSLQPLLTSQVPVQKRCWTSFSTLAPTLSCHSDPLPSTPPTARGGRSALGSIHTKLQICFWVSWFSLHVFCFETP